jgi:hypothetical protein
MGECITAVINMGSSIKINPGGSLPSILLGPDDQATTSRQSLQQPAATSASLQQPNSRAGPARNPHSSQAGPVHPRWGGDPQEERSYYGPAQANAEAGRPLFACKGCGRIGHRAPECRFKGHRNWNQQWADVPFRRSPIGLAIQKKAEGTGFNSLPANVEWDEVSGAWVESEALNTWRRTIRDSRDTAPTNQPRSSGGPPNSWGPAHDNQPRSSGGPTPFRKEYDIPCDHLILFS